MSEFAMHAHLAVEAVEALARKRAADALEAAAEESGDTE